MTTGAAGLVLGGTLGSVLLLGGGFALLLIGAEIFTNGVEWLGHRFGVSESATGSVLAAVGTALPETMIPVIAIGGDLLAGGGSAGDTVGVGAILGAPFMLATIAMFMVGVAAIKFEHRRAFGSEFRLDPATTRRDLSFFFVGYALALAVAFVDVPDVPGVVRGKVLVGLVLVALYVGYVYRSFQSGEEIAGGELADLHLGAVIEEGERPFREFGLDPDHSGDPGRPLVVVQTLLGLLVIVGGAHLFVHEVRWAADVVGLPAAILALVLAPLATELPEKFNSVLWISRDKDTLAIGNITGAMVFQGTLPVALGLAFTSWDLSMDWGTVGFVNAFSAVLALIGGAIVYLRVRSSPDGRMRPAPFLVGGALYLLFLVVLCWHVFVTGIAVPVGH